MKELSKADQRLDLGVQIGTDNSDVLAKLTI